MKSFFTSIDPGINAFGVDFSANQIEDFLNSWRNSINDFNFILILAGSRTSEIDGISWAGLTPQSRRYTAIADAELILNGPLSSSRWPLPSLPGGISPAVISYAATKFIGINPLVIVDGLLYSPPFIHLLFDSPSIGPANCLSSGKAMSLDRVKKLWDSGFEMGKRLKKPLLIAECVPGGTTTAHAVLKGLGLEVSELISGSVLKPPFLLKKNLVDEGLKAACLSSNSCAKSLISAVGDPFQAIATGLLIGASHAKQPVLLGGGSQMLAVLALSLLEVNPMLRSEFIANIAIGTTPWLVRESNCQNNSKSSFVSLMESISQFFGIGILGFCSGLNFQSSKKKVLRDYEIGYVKEGVGAGALSILAQLKGISLKDLVDVCELTVEQLELRKT